MNERRRGIDPTRTLAWLDLWASIGSIGRLFCLVTIILAVGWWGLIIWQVINWFRLLLG